MKNHKTIKTISSKTKRYIIMEQIPFNNGRHFYTVCKTRNWFKLMKEYFTDFIGETSIHPKFLGGFGSSDIEGQERLIKVHVKIDNENTSKKK